MSDAFDSEWEENSEKEDSRGDLIKEIAEGIFLGRITDDNLSCTNGLPSLEEIIGFGFDYEDEEELVEIKNAIYARVLDLSGGCDMFGTEEIEF